MPTPETLMATYARLKAKFEEIVAVEKQYSPGKVMAPSRMRRWPPEGWEPPVVLNYLQCAC